MDLADLSFNFYKTREEKLFEKVHSSASLCVKIPEEIDALLREEISKIEEYCESNIKKIPPFLYRARKNDYAQHKKFTPSQMGAPKANLASTGRAQLAGSSVLYLSNEIKTAIAEVKPAIGDKITIGRFKIKTSKELKILDLTSFRIKNLFEDVDLVYKLFNLSKLAFSAPIHSNDPKRYYPQIYLVQLIKDLGYDGIIYTSSALNEGKCFVFFDEKNFTCTRTSLHSIKSISIEFEDLKYSQIDRNYINSMKIK